MQAYVLNSAQVNNLMNLKSAEDLVWAFEEPVERYDVDFKKEPYPHLEADGYEIEGHLDFPEYH